MSVWGTVATDVVTDMVLWSQEPHHGGSKEVLVRLQPQPPAWSIIEIGADHFRYQSWWRRLACPPPDNNQNTPSLATVYLLEGLIVSIICSNLKLFFITIILDFVCVFMTFKTVKGRHNAR